MGTSSEPLMLLLAFVVYDLPTWTISLCLDVDSACTAVGYSIMLARQSGTLCQMNLEIKTALIVLNKNNSLQPLLVWPVHYRFFLTRCAIRFTYLFIYILTCSATFATTSTNTQLIYNNQKVTYAAERTLVSPSGVTLMVYMSNACNAYSTSLM